MGALNTSDKKRKDFNTNLKISRKIFVQGEPIY